MNMGYTAIEECAMDVFEICIRLELSSICHYELYTGSWFIVFMCNFACHLTFCGGRNGTVSDYHPCIFGSKTR